VNRKKTDRESGYETVIGLVVGFGCIALAMAPPNDIAYPPGDPRGQPLYDQQVSAIFIVLGVVVLLAVSARLVMWLRNRR
jgi:hypothetical protein